MSREQIQVQYMYIHVHVYTGKATVEAALLGLGLWGFLVKRDFLHGMEFSHTFFACYMGRCTVNRDKISAVYWTRTGCECFLSLLVCCVMAAKRIDLSLANKVKLGVNWNVQHLHF